MYTATELVETLAGRWADHAAVDLLDRLPGEAPTGDQVGGELVRATLRPDRAVFRRVAVAHGSGARHPGILLPTGRLLIVPAHSPVPASLFRGETMHIPHADSLTADHLMSQLGTGQSAASLRNCSTLLVPLLVPFTASKKILGHVMLIREPHHGPFSDDTVATVEALARWAARSMDSDRQCDQAAHLVNQLRQGFWPEPTPRPADIQLCYRYLPESRIAQIGGDWFDVIALTGGKVALVIGDVMGHGINAAIVMNRCKTIVRTLTLLGMPPDEVLRRFDELVRQHDDDHIATCLVVIYNRATRQCNAANAGQIPPMLIDPEGDGQVLDLPTGGPVGVGGLAFESRSFTTAPGSILALCTDGLTGLHDMDIDRALNRICAALCHPARPLEEICDDVFHGLDIAARKDDVTLLLARFPGPGNAAI
jgi:hypothetical protein